jgi:hypothetical protein
MVIDGSPSLGSELFVIVTTNLRVLSSCGVIRLNEGFVWPPRGKGVNRSVKDGARKRLYRPKLSDQLLMINFAVSTPQNTVPDKKAAEEKQHHCGGGQFCTRGFPH